ncbi:MAG: ABC transporter permease subunit, partial [Pseudomonadota bacterium]
MISGIKPNVEIDADERARLNRARFERWGTWALPVVVMTLVVFLWDRIVVWYDIKHYILPGPKRVLDSLIEGQAVFFDAWLLTLGVTAAALALAVLLGAGLAILFTQSRMVEMSLYPYAVILQVTPVVSIAPLIFIYVDSKVAGLLICAWIVAFFPVLSNTTLGLNSADHNLRDLFRIYGATRWQRLRYLQLPSALPYFLGGLRIAGGLSLIGAVVAELV